MTDISFEFEKYDGYWDSSGEVRSDPPGSDIRQYRAVLTVAQRIGERFQFAAVAPWVWNVSEYTGVSSSSSGVGDLQVTAWYMAVQESSAWRADSLADMVPEVELGATLTVPTGVSPYDDVESSFDVTGRGFYRLDANLYVAKTLHPWTGSLSASWGRYLQREVNREYGKYVEPYEKRLGDRLSMAASLGYIMYFGTGGDTVTATATFSRVAEGDAKVDGETMENSGFAKSAAGLALSYSSTDHDWSARVGVTHSLAYGGWGEDFPITDVYSVGVRHGFR